MKSTNLEKKKFGGKTHRDLSGLALLLCMAVCIVGIVIAYFFSDDFSSNNVNMSGRVEIVAVGNGTEYPSTENPANYPVIEDTDTSNLIIKLEDNYDVLIPGMEIEAFANVKVMYSSTKPLLRAKFELELSDISTEDTNEDGVIDEKDRVVLNNEYSSELTKNIRNQFNSTIIADNDWLKFSDGYFYYIGDNIEDDTDPKYTQLEEVDATVNDQIIFFLDKPFIFPTFVTSDYSSLGVKIIVTFEAIQNFIPDEDGKEYFYEKEEGVLINNTIEFSKYIFDDIRDPATSTDTRHNVILTIDGVSTQYAFTPGITLAEALTNEGITITDSNSCGWFSDYGLTEPILTTDIITNGMYLYTKTATPEKLTFTASGSNYHVSALNTSITGDVVIPRVYNGGLVTEIKANGFQSCTKIENLTLPASITVINSQGLFELRGCKKINITEGLLTIKDNAFAYCDLITTIVISNSVSSVHESSFNFTNLNQIKVKENNTVYHSQNNCLIQTQEKMLVRGCKTSVIPNDNSVTTLGSQSFFGARGLKSIFIPKYITVIKVTAFTSSTSLIEIIVDEENPVFHSINNCIIETSTKTLIVGCKSSLIADDNTINSIGAFAFKASNITDIIIPNTITLINGGAFDDLSTLNSLFIPSSVVTILKHSTTYYSIVKASKNVTIYTDAPSKPAGWDADFNKTGTDTYATVHYGVSLQQYLVTTGQSK